MGSYIIKSCSLEHIQEYGEIYAKAFSGEPWNDCWKIEDAILHVSEILESKQSYGLECLTEGKVVGFILGSTMLFHYGRVFEINDLAVLPDYQRKGIATKLLERCLAEMEECGIKGVNLITTNEGILPGFYGKHGFEREDRVILMGREIE